MLQDDDAKRIVCEECGYLQQWVHIWCTSCRRGYGGGGGCRSRRCIDGIF